MILVQRHEDLFIFLRYHPTRTIRSLYCFHLIAKEMPANNKKRDTLIQSVNCFLIACGQRGFSTNVSRGLVWGVYYCVRIVIPLQVCHTSWSCQRWSYHCVPFFPCRFFMATLWIWHWSGGTSGSGSCVSCCCRISPCTSSMASRNSVESSQRITNCSFLQGSTNRLH